MAEPNVAIVGITGAVGQEMINCLESRNFPINELRPLASARSAGKKINRLKRMSFNIISIFSYSRLFENPYYWRKLKRYF